VHDVVHEDGAVARVGEVPRVPGVLFTGDFQIERCDCGVGGRTGAKNLRANAGAEVVEAEFKEHVGHLGWLSKIAISFRLRDALPIWV
jgi:hypothetical protein